MRKFTKSLLTLALLVLAVGGAKAQDEIVTDFDATFYHQWDEVSATATDLGSGGGGVKLNEELGGNTAFWGNLTGAVPYLYYANITEYTELRIEGTPGLSLRVMCNRTVNEGPIYEINPKIGDDGKLTISVADLKYTNGKVACDFVCLQAMKTGYGQTGTITSMKIVKPADPLEIPKDNLRKAIALGKLQNSFAKTAASFAVLTGAITDGEEALADGSATAESLNAATQAIAEAYAGLVLLPGYTKLTKEMANANVDYVLNESTGLPYGNGSVSKDIYADLSAYDKLIVVASAGVPRFCMNRQTANGQIGATMAESNMIDINTQGDYASFTWATDAYLTVDEKVYTVDLKKISDDWNGEVKLHCIKGWNYANVTVTDLLLYRTPKTVTIGSAGYATFSADKAVKIQGVTAYAAKLNGNTVTLTPVTEVPANNAVILEGAADTYNFTVLDNAAAIANNDLLVSDGNASGSNIYVLADGANGVGFYKLASSDKVPAGKGYLTIGSGAAPEFLGFGGDATGINEVKAVEAKGEFFNLAGQRVAKPAKGLYIANGKKVIIK